MAKKATEKRTRRTATKAGTARRATKSRPEPTVTQRIVESAQAVGKWVKETAQTVAAKGAELLHINKSDDGKPAEGSAPATGTDAAKSRS
jgi:hypothetical protein